MRFLVSAGQQSGGLWHDGSVVGNYSVSRESRKWVTVFYYGANSSHPAA